MARRTLFQFHKGTIRTLFTPGFRAFRMYFNSIKVRLELIPADGRIGSATFQFHKGTIRTHQSNLHAYTNEFQFHKGTIRTGIAGQDEPEFLIFQFHKGTIRTISAPRGWSVPTISIP